MVTDKRGIKQMYSSFTRRQCFCLSFCFIVTSINNEKKHFLAIVSIPFVHIFTRYIVLFKLRVQYWSSGESGGVVQEVRPPPKAPIYFNLKLLIHAQGHTIKSGRTPLFAELQISPCWSTANVMYWLLPLWNSETIQKLLSKH